jgi:hypothetical protein
MFSRYRIAALFLLALTYGAKSGARADSPHISTDEVREFQVLVKDKPAGACTMRISTADDGTTRVTCDVNVKVSYLVYSYRYEFHGDELWQGNQLLSAHNEATDDGKKFAARLENKSGGAIIESNGLLRRTAAIDMTTNYWHTPDMSKTTKLNVMNADRGTVHSVTIATVGREKMFVDRREIDCVHYRLTGDIEAELWFDGQNRIVGQKSVEDGYPTELRLTRISSPPTRTARR